MKKIYVASLSLLVLFASCKKNNDNASTQHMHFNFAGTNKALDSGMIASIVPTSGSTTVTVYGSNLTGGEAIELTMYLNGNNPTVKVGTYSDTTSNVQIGITYLPNTTGDDYTCGTYTYQAAQWVGATFGHSVIQITSVDASSIRGTFSGDMAFNTGFTTIKKLTSGDFYAKLR